MKRAISRVLGLKKLHHSSWLDWSCWDLMIRQESWKTSFYIKKFTGWIILVHHMEKEIPSHHHLPKLTTLHILEQFHTPPQKKKKTNGWNLKNSPLGKGKIIFHNLHGFGFQPLVLLGSHFLPQAKAMTDALLRIGAANPKIFMETGGLGNRMPWTSEFLTTAIG